MFDPPPGDVDFDSDAEDGPYATRFAELEVPGVGVVLARKPMPNAVAVLRKAANSKLPNGEQARHVKRFVRNHLADGEWDRVTNLMLDDDVGAVDADAVQLIARAISTWGTARPYVAVITLSVMAAYFWRTIRLKYTLAGVADPMRLPSMHTVLDMTEHVLLESMIEDTPQATVARRRDFLDRLYAPLPETKTLNGPDYVATPHGFAPEDVEASFDAFAKAAH